MSVTVNGTNGLTFNDGSSQQTAASGFGFKNRIINGAMQVDQRNAGASVNNAAATGTYTLDRWRCYGTSASKFSVQQNAGSVTPPVGFTNYLGITSLSANSPASGDEYVIQQYVEGFNIADFAWGTANASAVTLSFKVYSSLTGTFSGAVKNSAADRTYPFSYTVSSANTWTSISVTIPGDTTGTWLTNNGRGLQVMWNLGTGSTNLTTGGAWTATFANGVTGSVNVLGTNGATFYITGVQLEKGSTATSFDYRPYGTELALCQRYYFRNTPGGAYSQLGCNSVAYSTSSVAGPAMFPVQMRATPSAAISNARIVNGNNAGLVPSSLTLAWAGTWATEITFNVTGATQNSPYWLQCNNNAAGYFELSAEL